MTRSTRRYTVIPREADLPRGPHGRCLCRVCSVEVPPHRRTYCSQECVDAQANDVELQVRRSPSFAREQVWLRDRGVCAACGFDIKPLLREHWSKHTSDAEWIKKAVENGYDSGHLWQMDHIVPVCEGGGECGLDNLRTLCTACHRRETRELARRRRSMPIVNRSA